MDPGMGEEPPDLSKFLSIYISEEANSINPESLQAEEDNGVSVHDFLNGLCDTTITPIANDELAEDNLLGSSSKKSFSEHFERFGPSNGKYCDICQKYFARGKFTSHLRTHTGEKPYVCDFCDNAYNRKDRLTAHCRSHFGDGSRHECICGRTFARLHHLKLHVESHDRLSKEFREKIMEHAKSKMEMKFTTSKGLLRCNYCSMGFPGKYKLSRHIRTHTGDKPYKCQCGVKFTRNEHLKKHRLCKSCPYNKGENLGPNDDTKVDCSVQNIKTEVADVEDAMTMKANGLQEETSEPGTMQWQENEPDSMKWSKKSTTAEIVVKEEPTDHEQLNDEEDSQHLILSETWKKFAKNIKAHICEFCQKVFSKNHKLNIHRRIHTGEKPFSCNTCGKGFSRKDHLLKHKNVHLKYRKATTTYYLSQSTPDQNNANSAFFHDMNMAAESGQIGLMPQVSEAQNDYNEKSNIVHSIVTEEEVVYFCPICNRSFKKYSKFQSHMEVHGERELFMCPICNRAFKVKKNFEAHLLNHHTSDGSPVISLANSYLELAKAKRAQCPVCKKWLVNQSSLIMHMRSHTGEKPHKCETCDSYFVRKADMVRHRKRHTGENLFECEYCSASYTRRDKLAAHVRKNHPDTLPS